MEEKKSGRQYLQVNTRSPRWEGMWLDVESGGPPDREARGSVKPKSRRCMATKSDGSPCRLWAVRKSEPALCVAHSAWAADAVEDGDEDGDLQDEPSSFAWSKGNPWPEILFGCTVLRVAFTGFF